MEAALVDLFSNLWSPSTPSLLPLPPSPRRTPTHRNPPRITHLRERRRCNAICSWPACPHTTFATQVQALPSCRVLPRPKLCCPLLPIVALLGSHPRPPVRSPSPVHSPPSLWCRIITSVLSRWISRADPGLTAAIALPKRSKQRTRQAPGKRARSLAFFLFSTTRETQKGTSTPGPIFSDQSLARSPPRPRLHRRQHATYCTVRGCLASRFPLSAFRSLSCCCWWHRIAVDVVWRKGSENSAPVEFPEFHPLSRPRPDQDEPAAGETDD